MAKWNFSVDDDLDKKAFEAAHDQRISKSQYVREAVRERLNRGTIKVLPTHKPIINDIEKQTKQNYLLFGDLRNRAGERNLPTDRKTWLRYEEKGLVKFRTLPTGRRIFKDMAEIDAYLDKFEKLSKS